MCEEELREWVRWAGFEDVKTRGEHARREVLKGPLGASVHLG